MFPRSYIKYLYNFGYPCTPEITLNIYVTPDIHVTFKYLE